MVLNADARRDRAVARLARWTDRFNRWFVIDVIVDVPGLIFPFARFARARRAAAERAVERAAAADIRFGRIGPDRPAVFRVPAHGTEQFAAAYVAAVKHYCAATVEQLAGYSGDAAGLRRPAAGEGVPGPRQAREVRRRLWR